ncbi:hypothetical protein [Virgisporangium aurantiacum]|uniref:Uncharacterized protein n=1 Tax=Virgisporangium aurantiacum TaxID=175570 RepID=A0A8J4E1A3_9ACTN|nr:hypothetical protein [Virgisporangium aurantiacum]GIJ57641.1 hypothetical protein Vau01_051570 [Virgisporangium aurantiacum]
MVDRLAPGGYRVPSDALGRLSGYKRCIVDTANEPFISTGPVRSFLQLEVAVDGSGLYGEAWRSSRCAELGAEPTPAGPGDVSCLEVAGWDGSEIRIKGWAWVGDRYQAWLIYRLFKPDELPDGAERDLRELFAAAVDSLPT